MIYHEFKTVSAFDWKDLHKKFFQLIYIPPNVECLERYGQVYLVDEKHTFYLVKELDGLKDD